MGKILGVSSLGKVSYVITLAPYFILTALLAYAAQREVKVFYVSSNESISTFQGAVDGMEALVSPNWEVFKNYDVN